MTTETLMTSATTTTEGETASQPATTTPATVADEGGQQTPASSQPAEGQQKPAEGSEGEQKAPESYDFKAPEGQQFDEGIIGAFSEVAKELSLSQEAAQKVLDKMAPTLAARQSEQIAAAQAAWAESAKTDKEFGGDKLDANLATAKKALDTFGTPEFKALLNESGLGNHPEVIRVLYRAGKAIAPDAVVTGRATTQADRLATLYDKT